MITAQQSKIGENTMVIDKMDKIYRLLQLHERLSRGETIVKSDVLAEFGIPDKTFQRDIDSLRNYYFEQGGRQLVYERKGNYYHLVESPEQLTKQEIFAVCKVLMESRAFNKAEFNGIISKLLHQCEPASKKAVQSLIANERVNYIPLQHGKAIIELLWSLGENIKSQNVVRFNYKRLDNMVHSREVKPVGIMFSEFYFYLIGFMADGSKKFPTVFRIDRISGLEQLEQRFSIPYAKRFSEAEFRKRVQFMYAGELRTVRFLYRGSLEALFDRLPTAQVEQQTDKGTIIRAETYGDGIYMWLRSQGDRVEML